MNYVNQFEEKYLPNFYKGRQKTRIHEAFKLKDKAQNNPQQLTMAELRLLLIVLNQKKFIPIQKQHIQAQQQTINAAIYSFIPGVCFSFMPFLFRQFHKISRGKQFVTAGGIGFLTYIACVLPPLHKLNEYNRSIASKYASKLVLTKQDQF